MLWWEDENVVAVTDQMFWAGPGSQPSGAFVWARTCSGFARTARRKNCKNGIVSPGAWGIIRVSKDTWMCWAPPAVGRGKQLDERGTKGHTTENSKPTDRRNARVQGQDLNFYVTFKTSRPQIQKVSWCWWHQAVMFWLLLTLQSRCSRLWSEAHLRWSSESSSTWLSRLKCSRASFSCISRTCSSCSKEHTFPRWQKRPIGTQVDFKVKCFWGFRSVKIALWSFDSYTREAKIELNLFAAGIRIFPRWHPGWVWLTKSLQLAWVEVVEEVEEASLHLSHIGHVRQKGVLQGRRLDYFAGPCRLRGPGFLLVGSE